MKRILSSLLMAAICLTACNSHQQKALQAVESYIETKPDSSLQSLKQIPYDNLNQKQKAVYGILLFQALDMTYRDLQPDSIIDFSIRYARSKTDKDILAKALLYKGRSYSYASQTDSAMYCYVEAFGLADQKDHALLGRLNSDVARLYDWRQNYEKVQSYRIQAIDHFKETPFKHLVCDNLILLGQNYSQRKLWDSAHYVFRKAQQLYVEDSLHQSLLLMSVGRNFLDEWEENKKNECLDSALFYIQESLLYPDFSDWKSEKHYYLSHIYYRRKELDSAFVYATMALQENPDVWTARLCYAILTNVSYRKKDIGDMNTYLKLHTLYNDSVESLNKQTQLPMIQNLYASNQAVQQSQHHNKHLWLTLVLALLLLSAIIVFIQHRLKINKKQKQKTEQDLLREKLQLMREKMKTIRVSVPLNKDDLYREKCRDYLHYHQSEKFSEKINAELNGFLDSLVLAHPNLSEYDRMLCCLILLDCPTEQIAILCNIKTDTVYSRRKTLKKRLDLQGDKKIKTYLESLL